MDPITPLPPSGLRWTCDESWLKFETTDDLDPIRTIVGQDDAMDALRFGLEIGGPGQNIFVRGLTGTGRMTLVKQLLEEIQPHRPLAADRVYVHNFEQPERPRLLALPPGSGETFKDLVEELIAFIEGDLIPALGSDVVRSRRNALNDRLQEALNALGRPFKEELAAADLALVPVQVGESIHPAIMPVVDDEPLPPERFNELRKEGKISDERAEEIHRKIEEFGKRFQEVSEKTLELQAGHRDAVGAMIQAEARRLLTAEVKRIRARFPQDGVQAFLDQLVADFVKNRIRTLDRERSFTRVYKVNVVLSHGAGDPSPFIIENTPTLGNLLGTIDREFAGQNHVRSDHLMIKGGSLLGADGGFLIMEARDVLSEPGAWKVLVRTLRTGKLEIVPSEFSYMAIGPHLKPEPIDINVKVVLLGDPSLYYLLDAYDADFPHLFKVLADFDSSIPRDEQGVNYYAGWLARLARHENLPPFARSSVAALAEHGARIASQRDRLTTRFGRLADIAREAAHDAGRDGATTVTGDHVRQAVRFSRRRADLPARRFRRHLAEGTIRVQVQGSVVGQVNGLAVITAGPLTYGFPSRITATIGPGTAGAINIERESQLSGAIHTKGFYILGGLLRHLLRTEHPLAFSASVAFEQSYGGIDGDSASCAEVCCLLSSLTGVPLRQDLAMTGAIDQHGHALPVGAVTEKIEGFYDACEVLGLTGTQGVVVPRANARDLMLRADVVEAAAAGKFHVVAVENVSQALAVLTGWEPGEPDAAGGYPEGTLLRLAKDKALEYWLKASATPAMLRKPGGGADEEAEEETKA